MTDETNESIAPTEPIDEIHGTADHVAARDAHITDSLIGAVQAEGSASITDSACGAVVAGQGAQVENSFSQAVVAGAGIEMKNSGGGILVAGAGIDLQNSSTGILYSRKAKVENSTIAVLLTPQAELGQNVKVQMSTVQAIAFGAAFGLFAGLLGFLLRRRR
ncbi:hypothetical protein LARV_01466 [Longilinea arvoryzae]|uniref:Uncharacterized protein n=1 Tax=Longilinea arvoryzae TaxID=360412 RepID=A0A0S7B893_9CHLR|nr:hypothetical protein [Longilinea arvoryzae]GAP13711.1 hypothetical protein LARV_01466 [Longilinea arvoryzae]